MSIFNLKKPKALGTGQMIQMVEFQIRKFSQNC